jgi:hypothetical protein
MKYEMEGDVHMLYHIHTFFWPEPEIYKTNYKQHVK